jgi:hypothetical protein
MFEQRWEEGKEREERAKIREWDETVQRGGRAAKGKWPAGGREL